MPRILSCVLNNENHVLHPLLPNRNEHGYELPRRRHERILTSNDDKRNFVYRQLHKYSYQALFPYPTLHVSLLFNCVLTILNKRIRYVMLSLWYSTATNHLTASTQLIHS